jgi:putative hydrolase of the HAD superfamily
MGDREVTPPPFPGVKAIVFDLDGTLYQNDRISSEVSLSDCRYLAQVKGISVTQAETMLRGARDSQSGAGGTLSQALISLGGDLKEMHRRLSLDLQPEVLLSVDARVCQLLKKLAVTFDLYVYTNNNRDLSKRTMERIGVAHLFKRVFTIEDYWRPKPDETALAGILDAISRKPAETLFVGDRYEVDLALPESLGCAIFKARSAEELLTLAQHLLSSFS